MDAVEAEFVKFARTIEPGLRVALVATHGVDRGREATNDALVYAWSHWERVRSLDNPGGYLFRVGQRKARRHRLTPRVPWTDVANNGNPWVEPRLSQALVALSPRQRQVVVLIESYEYTQREVSKLLGIGLSSVQTHLERGLERLRAALRVSDHG